MNILFTTLSVTSRLTANFYYTKQGGAEKWCAGIQQQEPGAKKFLSEVDIDKIVIIGSEETTKNGNAEKDKEIFKPDSPGSLCNDNLRCWKGKLDIIKARKNAPSALRLLVCRLADFVYGDNSKDPVAEAFQTTGYDDAYNNYQNRISLHMQPLPQNKEKEIKVVFVRDLDSSGNENLKMLVNELRGTAENPNKLYMDMQGGARTAIYIHNALLQLLSAQSDVYHTSLERIVATNFTPNQDPFAQENKNNEIADETARYYFIDLASGMNAFLDYGKSDLLVKYLEKIKRESGAGDENVAKLISGIRDLDNAITFCRIKGSKTGSAVGSLETAVQNLSSAIKTMEEKTATSKNSRFSNYFDVLLDGIKSDLGDLYTQEADNIDVLTLLEWLVKKQNYVTATAVAEDGLPSFFVAHGILYYAKSREEKEAAGRYFAEQLNSAPKKEQWLFQNINHYFIKNYLRSNNLMPYYKNYERDVIPGKAQALTNVLNGGSAELPVKLYSDAGMINGMPMASHLISLYAFISKSRNSLAHANNQSTVAPETLKNRLRELVNKLRKFRDTSTAFYLEDESVYKAWKNANS